MCNNVNILQRIAKFKSSKNHDSVNTNDTKWKINKYIYLNWNAFKQRKFIDVVYLDGRLK